MDERLPLSALLSQTLVAFTIEFDNEFEHLVPHRTTNYGSTASSGTAPWLVSMVMWLMLMRFVPDDGIVVKDLQQSANLSAKDLRLLLTRMSKWWRYLDIKKDAGTWVVRPSSGGRRALEVWRPLTEVIEKRWQERFGRDVITRLLEALQTLANEVGSDLPDHMPILGYGLFSKAPDKARQTPACEPTLPILLAKVLLAFAIEFERDSGLSLAISANVLRLSTDDGVPVRDLPRLSGVSKEAIAMALGSLQKQKLALTGTDPLRSRVKLLTLTETGRHARETYRHLVFEIEERWRVAFGHSSIDVVRVLLEQFVGEPTANRSPLCKGLEPYPDGWRASARRIAVLPHYPMVLHRGGFPDGS